MALPTRTLIDCPVPKPMSSDVEYSKWWTSGIHEMDVDRIVRRWRMRRKDL